MEYRIISYQREYREMWNAFVKTARNSTFLFDRRYMDYHSDRFSDCSWMVFKGNRLIALLPANLDSGGVLHSHQGLTYGGWILPPSHLDGGDLLEIFNAAVDIWKKEGIRQLDYKPLPYIYASRPSEEDIYALFRLGARESEVNLSSAIDLHEPLHYNKLRKRTLKKSEDLSFRIEECHDSDIFMGLVGRCLRERHSALPVHSAAEISRLRADFPENIRMFTIGDFIEGNFEIAGGVMVYDTGRVAHAQYIASTEHGREHNLLTPLFDRLIRVVYHDRKFFDFGTSNEDHGRYLNEGLLRQKYSYGATGVAYRRFTLDL